MTACNPNATAGLLDNISIASPCTANWEVMTGDDRVRFCGQCQLNVYNLSDMPRQEAEALLQAREGRLCVRYYQRADGTVLTQDCPVGLQALHRRNRVRMGRGIAAAVTLITVVGVFSAVAFASEKVGKPQAPTTKQTPSPHPAMMGAPAPIEQGEVSIKKPVQPPVKEPKTKPPVKMGDYAPTPAK